MIVIEKSITADSRTAETVVTKEELEASTKQHIGDVKKAMYFFADKLKESADKHDWSKLEFIDEFHDDFAKSQTDKSFKFKKGKWFKKHIQERHHLLDRCPDDVNMIDIIERISDITMAGMGRSGEVFDDEISNEILQKAFKNTLELLKSEILVIDSDEAILNSKVL